MELDSEGLILGIKPSVVFEEGSILLQPGDLILFYTDGINEATSPEGDLFGTGRICLHLSSFAAESADTIADTLYQEALDYSSTRGLADDISMVVLKIIS